MNLRIRRRRFGQLAIGSAAATAIANLAGKVVAQQLPTGIIGVSLSTANNLSSTLTSNLSSTLTSNLSSTLTNTVGNIADIANSAPAVVLTTSDVNTGKTLSTVQVPATPVQNLTTLTEAVGKAVSQQSSERITGLTALSDGTLITASVVNSIQGDVTRLIFTKTNSSNAPTSLKVSGFQQPNSTVESLLAIKGNTIIASVSLNGGVPPFQLVTIDGTSGIVNSSNALGLPDLLPIRRLANFAQSSDGTIYATTLDPEGITFLVQINLTNKSFITGKGIIIKVAPLTLNNNPLQNDLRSVAFSPSNQLFALADPSSSGTNSLYTMDVKTGVLTHLRPFQADHIAFIGS